MTVMTGRWELVEPILREKAYGTIDNDPQVLLADDAGGLGIDADLFHARLIGFDDQIDAEMWVRRAESDIYVPLPPKLTPIDFDIETMTPELRKAVYKLQSGWVVMTVNGEDAPPHIELRPDFTIRVAYLRYRRRG